MSKALGFVPASYNLTGSLNIPKDEKQYVEAIKSLFNLARDLHNQVSLQSFAYNPEASEYINQAFDPNKVNRFSYVHPTVAALFLPKFDVIDSHMICASIAKIVTLKDDGIPLQTQPEYELYWDIATDPSETTCSTKSKPFSDLVTRCTVQHKLWESVLNLRQGKPYIE